MAYRHFNNESTRSSVLKAVRGDGNEQAWQKLFDFYAGYIFSIARSKGLKAEDADDIVQIVFSDLARNLPNFEYDRRKGRFRSYLSALVNWRVTDYLRIGRREVDLMASFTPDENYRPEPFEEQEWQAAAMEEALRRIKAEVRPDHYAAFVASAMEGQDADTVAKLHGLTRDNLYQIRKRLTVKLRGTVAKVLAEMDSPDAPDPRA